MAPTPKKKRTPKAKASKAAYQLTVTVGTDVYTSSAEDVQSALLSLTVSKLNARATFTLEHEGKTATLQKNVFHARRALSSPLNAFVLARNLTTLLK